MKTLTVFGCSDDLIETNGIDGCDEFANYGDTYKGYLLVDDGQQGINIHIIYNGNWSFAVAPDFDKYDGEKLPDWPIRRIWGKDMDYSETLEIDVPDNAKLEYVE